MGEVFHAVRVGPGGFRKPVALKRLALDRSIDSRMVQRFFAEARISARLEHENVVRIHDLLVVDDGHFIVMELLTGRNLASLRGDLAEVPWWLPFAVAEQALAGLEYAHALSDERGKPLGLVHRDLTPRNLFVCATGVVKVLDFGIAKLRHALTPALTRDAQLQGTIEFVAPEQARGEAADGRTDLYQLAGSVYWALTGEFPHGSGSVAEIVARTLAGTIRPLARDDVPRRAAMLLERAMAPDPGDRFAGATEMRAELQEILRGVESGTDTIAALVTTPAPELAEESVVEETPPSLEPYASTVVTSPSANRRPLIAIGIVAIAGVLAFLLGRSMTPSAPAAEPSVYHRVTFRRGMVTAARFAPDRKSLVFSAAWGGNPSDIYLATIDNPEGRSLDLSGNELLSVSPTGEIALLRDVNIRMNFVRVGNMTTTSLAGGVQRSRYADVQWAEWAPDGSLVMVRWYGNTTRLEHPPGRVLFESDTEWIESPRIAPDGESIAFVRHEQRRNTAGRIAIVDAGGVRNLTEKLKNAVGLVWCADGNEIWFGGNEYANEHDTDLHAVTLDGKHRIVTRSPGSVRPTDVDPLGRLLLVRETHEMSVSAKPRDDTRERDLSWFDYTWVTDISPDGQLVALSETGGAAGPGFGVYVRKIDGSGGMRIGDGISQTISPDKSWVLSLTPSFDRLLAIPTGTGEPREIGRGTAHGWAWLSATSVFYCGAEAASERCFIVDLHGKRSPRPVAGYVHLGWFQASPDGNTIAAQTIGEERVVLVDVRAGTLQPLVGALGGERPIHWIRDGATLLVAKFGEVPLRIFAIDVATGAREPWRELVPPDASGVTQVIVFVITPDTLAYAYSYQRRLGTLYLAEGMR